jgi:hypothetical protein
MSIEDEKQRKDLQELRKIHSLKDARTPSGNLTAHGLRLERVLDVYRKGIKELDRIYALEDPRSGEPCLEDTTRRRQKGTNDSAN